jgi:hypothetical protein
MEVSEWGANATGIWNTLLRAFLNYVYSVRANNFNVYLYCSYGCSLAKCAEILLTRPMAGTGRSGSQHGETGFRPDTCDLHWCLAWKKRRHIERLRRFIALWLCWGHGLMDVECVISSLWCFRTQWLLCAPPVQVQALYCTVYKSGYCVLRQYRYKYCTVQCTKGVTVCSASTSTLLYSVQKWLVRF